MKTRATRVTMMALAALVGTASARNIAVSAGPVIPVCVEEGNPMVDLFQAEHLASQMFLTADVTIQWHASKNCPANGIRISLTQNVPPSDHPHAYAYALPYEGTHIVVFRDRIEAATGPRAHHFLLAHVLVHEITHVLEGTCRHSETGVLKASFTQHDISQMEFEPLPFAAEDLELIQIGLAARQTRLAQVQANSQASPAVEAAVTR